MSNTPLVIYGQTVIPQGSTIHNPPVGDPYKVKTDNPEPIGLVQPPYVIPEGMQFNLRTLWFEGYNKAAESNGGIRIDNGPSCTSNGQTGTLIMNVDLWYPPGFQIDVFITTSFKIPARAACSRGG